MNYLIALLCVEIGLLAGWISFDVLFYEPLRKKFIQQNKEVHEFLDEQIATLEAIRTPVQENGSMISPIQIKKEE